MNIYVAAGMVCLAIWGVLVYGAGIGTGPVHAIVAVGFLLVARGRLSNRKT